MSNITELTFNERSKVFDNTVVITRKISLTSLNVGIDKALWKDHSLDKCGIRRMSPLHTHDNKGMVRLESSVNRDYTLGEFLDIWGALDTASVKMLKATVNDQSISDWRNHILKDKEQISLEIS